MTPRRAARTAAIVAAGALLALGAWRWVGPSVPEAKRAPDEAGAVQFAPAAMAPPPANTPEPSPRGEDVARGGPGAAPAPPPDPDGTWRLTVHLRDPDGAQVWGRVMLVDARGKVTERAETDDDGDAEFRVRGSTRVLVAARRHAPCLGEPLEHPPDGTHEITVVPERGLAVEGVVLDQDGALPVARARVYATRAEPIKGVLDADLGLPERVTGADGRFRIEGLLDGTVELTVTAGDSEAGGPRTLSVGAGDTGVRVVLAPRCFVDFEAVDAAAGGPLTTAVVSVIEVADDGNEREVVRSTTPAAGPVGAARSRLGTTEVSTPGAPRFRVRATGYEPTSVRTIDLAAGTRRATMRFEMRADPEGVATLRLHARTEDGTPLRRVVVTRSSDLPAERWSGEVPVEGGIATWRTEPGIARIVVAADSPLVHGRPPYWVPVPLELDLTRGHVADHDVLLRRGGLLLLRGLGQPLPEVRLLDASGTAVKPKWAPRWGEPGGRHWSLGPLLPGTLRVEFPEDSGLKSFDTTIRANEITTIDLSPPAEPPAATVEEDASD